MYKTFTIVSLNVGKPQYVTYQNQDYQTAIHKKPVDEKVYLNRLNLLGDRQADLENHGGVNMAICVYPYDHYAYWEKEFNIILPSAAFGENLTVQGLTEDKVHIGDIFQFGEAIVQVSQPRQPCFKVANKLGIKDLALLIQQTGYSGYYLRVLKEGWVSKETPLVLIEAHPQKVSVQMVNQVKYHDTMNIEKIEEIIRVQELSENWRATLAKRL